MTNGNQKGKAGERELAALLTKAGHPAHRSQQFCGRGEDASDVICQSLGHLHFECKRVQSLQIYKALEQATRDAKGKKIPVVAHRKNNEEWLAILTLKDFLQLLPKSQFVDIEVDAADLHKELSELKFIDEKETKT